MKKYLRCFKDGLGITAGKVYEVIREERGYFVFIDDDKDEHLWSQGSVRGESYLDHFTLETEDDNAPITVLPDESLGGVMREYREVKRKAVVGERVKFVGFDGKGHGHVDVVTSVDYTGDVSFDSYEDIDGDETCGYAMGAYTVLEPSDILVIDGARYRTVDRKAAVGERVIITNAEPGYGYKQGGVYEIKTLDCDDPCIWPDGSYKSEVYLEQQEYRVLEPVNSAATPQLSELPASDQIAENIAALAACVTGLEAKVAELMRSVIEAGNPAELSVSSAQAETWTKVASGPVNTKLPTYLSPQQIRDEIVERAKADLDGVKEPWNINANPLPLVYVYKQYVVDVEFVVNRDKRTVVAIARWRYNGEIVSRGIAKCAPNDVFNAHIGRAIALRRALGLEVPAEYLSVPNPEEVRVGDVVRLPSTDSVREVASVTKSHVNYTNGRCNSLHVPIIIDDSREEVAA